MYDIKKVETCNEITPLEQLPEILARCREGLKISYRRTRQNGKNVIYKYIDMPISFDIETCSFYDRENKCSCMYVWALSVCGFVFIGRTWAQWVDAVDVIAKTLETSDSLRACIYVHNLGYEFQYMRKWFTGEWVDVFSLAKREPVRALLSNGVEFRDSYALTGKKLASVAKDLHTVKISKLVGDVDYTLIRHSGTPLTDKDIKYSVNDVNIIIALIHEKIEQDGGIANIPMTKTGYIRRLVKDACYKDASNPRTRSKKYQWYRGIMKRLTVEPDEYKQLKAAFAGGYTHADIGYTGRTVSDVFSVDFASSYPAQMCSASGYPMSKGERVEIESAEHFTDLINNFACVFSVEFENIESKILQDNYISLSRCHYCESSDSVKKVINNGRVMSAGKLCTTITEVDYKIIRECYKWDSVRVFNLWKYKRGRLPKPIIMTVLDLFSKKTSLKGVDPVEYLSAKELLNSCYGMTVTEILKGLITYEGDEWGAKAPDVAEGLEKYNDNKGRFLFYPWGVYITAFARAALWGAGLEGLAPCTTGILEAGTDYIYSDTDSIKIKHVNKHHKAIERYNIYITAKLLEMCDAYNIDPATIAPKTSKGVTKHLGIWEPDDYKTDGIAGKIKRFKTLGAKRYIAEDDSGTHVTIAGVSKTPAAEYLTSTGDAFKTFEDGLQFSAEHTGKLTHTYIDDENGGDIVDYLGNEGEWRELSYIHLEPCEYSLSMVQDYKQLIFNIQERVTW